jgi:hypothetical protein
MTGMMRWAWGSHFGWSPPAPPTSTRHNLGVVVTMEGRKNFFFSKKNYFLA